MKLSEQQIENAAKAVHGHDFTTPLPWEDLGENQKEWYRVLARAAAPHLTAEWEMPSEEECGRFTDDYNSHDDGPCLSRRHALRQFVTRRNAKLNPPADPRREKITAIMRDDKRSFEQKVDAILALDKVEDK